MLSNQKGSPQCWAQDAMYICSYSVLTQLGLSLMLGCFFGDIQMDQHGNPQLPSPEYRPAVAILDVVKFLTFVGLYGGAATVVASILTIEPSTANCAARNEGLGLIASHIR